MGMGTGKETGGGGDAAEKTANGKAGEKKDEMSEEDQQLVMTLDMLIERLQDVDASLHRPALEALRTQIRSSSVSMTSVPKALKFLRHKYAALVAIHGALPDEHNKRFLADLLSVVAMTQSGEDTNAGAGANSTAPRDALKFRLLGEQQPIGDWGHEYVKHLAMDIVGEVAFCAASDQSAQHVLPLAVDIANFFLDHNAEPDACDLLYETGQLGLLPEMAVRDGRDHDRVCLYLMSCVPYEADLDDRAALQVAHRIYRLVEDYPQALMVAMRLNSPALIADNLHTCPDPVVKKQLAYMLARQRVAVDTADEELKSILNNQFLTDHFRAFGRDLEILEPKTPEDIYKSHLQDALRVPVVPSPRQNLASSFVNAFVNAGFGTDRLLTAPEIEEEESKSWIYKTKDHGVLSTVASIGMLHLWNADTGLAKLDRYLYSENTNIKAGAILGIGLVHAGTKNDSDPALALLREYLEDAASGVTIKTSALIGLALAYGGSARQDVAEPIIPFLADADMQVAAMAALAIGHVFVGTCNGDMASHILQTMMERDAAQLDLPVARFLALSLALLFLGKTETEAEVILETLQVIPHPIAKDATTLVKICSYAGSGNVLKIQELLHSCTEEQQAQPAGAAETDKEPPAGPSADKNYQTFSVIGIALICMMEDIGKEMSHRLFSHLMHFGSPAVRKAVPLALGLLYTSHPAVSVMELLSKYSHDHDKAVAVSATFAMGLIAAGSNNAKMAQMLRQLAAYYQRDPDCLYMVRIAQGLVHAGKGTVTLCPIHSQRQLINPAAVAGLLTTIVALTDAQALLLEGSSYLLYFLVAAVYPRFIITLNERLEAQPLLMRVGQAVDVVGQAGKPKNITGFQTHTTPVLLAYQERAELATEEYLAVTPILENFVIVRKNPEWVEESAALKKK